MGSSQFDRLTRRLADRTTRRTAVGTSLGAFALGALNHVAAAQATPASDATPASEGDEPVFLFVQTFAAGRGELNPGAGTPTAEGTPTPAGGASFLLTLEGHTGQTIYFSDRPDRIVGSSPTETFLDGFGFTPENPPNAALISEFRAGQGVVVVELIEPRYDAETGTLVYGAEVLEGYEGENLVPVVAEQVAERLPAEFGPAALFIDDCPKNVYTMCTASAYDPSDGEYTFYPCGPLPGGPYDLCWNLFAWGCVPCKHDWTFDELRDLCVLTYSSACYPV
jgi:hypothetical protein